jgi:antitoxin VapB
MQSRIFKSGNSYAVRIPKELAFDADVLEVDIERKGNGLWIRPVETQTLAGLGDIFAMFSPEFMAQERELNEQEERDWDVGLNDKDAA